MAVSGFPVEVERVNIDELRRRYPEAFGRPVHPAAGPGLECYLEGRILGGFSMARYYDHVFSPITVKGLEFKNRIEAAPTIPCFATPEGLATQELMEWYRAFARAGAAIVTVGDSVIEI